MRTVITEGVEYTCLDMAYIGEDNHTQWFIITEESHPMLGTKFGLRSFDQDSDDINFDIVAEKHVDMEALHPIVNDFVTVMMGEYIESQSD